MKVDALIVGSGPVGAAFARFILDHRPTSRVLMVEAGPRLTEPPGRNIRNLPDEDDRNRARARAGGPEAAASGAVLPLSLEGTITARDGTYLVDPDCAARGGDGQSGLPAAAMSSCVGGQATMWTCATPRPRGSERSDAIPASDWDRHLADGERLLRTSANPYTDTPALRAIQHRLTALFGAELPSGEGVRPLPVAGQASANGRIEWTGVDTILGPLLTSTSLELRDETVCREIVHDGRAAHGAVIEHLPTSVRETVEATVVIVAGNAMRTPQLLWASGIRPPALGRYLTEHPLTFAVVGLDPSLVAREGGARDVRPTGLDPALAALCIPYTEPDHPYHSQIMHFEVPPFPVADADRYSAGFVAMGWGTRKFPRAEDRVEFLDDRADPYGMPDMRIRYELTSADRAEIDGALSHVMRAAAGLGEILPGGEPKLMPGGTSLHYQGTTRLGRENDGASVCDTCSRVWGIHNLFLGGNGLIPTATACNPTLTSVALAARAIPKVVAVLG